MKIFMNYLSLNSLELVTAFVLPRGIKSYPNWICNGITLRVLCSMIWWEYFKHDPSPYLAISFFNIVISFLLRGECSVCNHPWTMACSMQDTTVPTPPTLRSENSSTSTQTHAPCTQKRRVNLQTHNLFRPSWSSLLAPSLLPFSCSLSLFLDICLTLRLAGVVGLPLLFIVALQPQPTWWGQQKGYVSSKAKTVFLRKQPKFITQTC